jgi:hypothetical protein
MILHSIDIEQAFLQDKFLEGVKGRYFLNPPPGAQMLTTRTLCMKCCDLHTEIPRRQEPYITKWMPSSRAKDLTRSDLRNLCGKGLTVANMLKISICQLTWMTALLPVVKGHYDRFQEENADTVKSY